MDVANTDDMDFLAFSAAQFDGVSESDWRANTVEAEVTRSHYGSVAVSLLSSSLSS